MAKELNANKIWKLALCNENVVPTTSIVISLGTSRNTLQDIHKLFPVIILKSNKKGPQEYLN